MNIVLFEATETTGPLARSDARAIHLLTVLRRAIGEKFDAGIVNGAMGKGWIASMTDDMLFLEFAWGSPTQPLAPIHVLVGLPRPQTARRILQEATSLGVGRLSFFQAEKGEPSYATSTLWTTDEWRKLLVAGAAQAFDTRIPEVTHADSLDEIVVSMNPTKTLIALDNYEAQGPLSAIARAARGPYVLAIGPERGWSGRERTVFRNNGFSLAHLGSRVLRAETALISAIAIVKTTIGEM